MANDEVRWSMSQEDIPGVSIAVVRDGEVVHTRSFGSAGPEERRPATDSTMYQLASVTKIVTGTVVMTLAEAGRLALDDSLHTHRPSLPDAWRGVTVREAMSHTSGLPNMVNPRTGEAYGGSTLDSAWSTVTAKPLKDTTATVWRYNQTGYEAMRRVLEAVADTSWPALARERVFEPAGMTRTFFLGEPAPDSGLVATAVDGDGTPVDFATDYAPRVLTGAGLYATAPDLARFSQALTSGRLLGAEARQTMWTSVPFDSTSIGALEGYGIGWTVGTEAGRRRVWHTGAGKAAFVHYPDDGLTVVALTNRTGFDVLNLATEVASAYLPASRQ